MRLEKFGRFAGMPWGLDIDNSRREQTLFEICELKVESMGNVDQTTIYEEVRQEPETISEVQEKVSVIEQGYREKKENRTKVLLNK